MTETKNIIKCIAVGDGYVGKTSLLTRLSNKEYEQDYTPTIFDNSSIEIVHKGVPYDLHLLDTAGQEGYENLRTQAYSNVNIFLVCFSVTNVDSFSNVKEVWLPEITKHSNGASIILVGTKMDLREDPETIDRMNISQEVFVSQEVAINFAKNYNIKYVECSARTKEHVQDVINAVLEVYLIKATSDGRYAVCCTNPIASFIKKVFCCKIRY